MKEIQVKTNKRVELIDITAQVKEAVKDMDITNGTVTVFSPHTTAAITINEGADPDVVKDMVAELNKIVPYNDNYHHLEGNSAAHIKTTLVGSGEMVIVDGGRLQLGRWQSIYFCEFDGPRERRVYLQVAARSI